MTDIKFLRDLAAKLLNVPATYGTDQGTADRLQRIADKLNDMDGIEFCEDCGEIATDLDDNDLCEDCAQEAHWNETAPGGRRGGTFR